VDAHLAFTFATGRRLHLGVCGSVAAYRAPDLVRQWQDAGLSVGVTLTEAAKRFITPLTFEALGASPVYGDIFDGGDGPFGHLEPGQCCHAFVIAPASAATLARLATGMADDMLACQALAFNGPLVVAPAMNPRMWAHPATRANVETLRQRGVVMVEPGCGRTACMEEGQGRLADLRAVHLAALRALAPQDMSGTRVMVTLGPTREKWDGVRYWTNPSSGVMGASLAVAAWLRGARVDAVCGPGAPWLPADIVRHDVGSADEMFEVAHDLWPDMDTGIFTAAVADFKPVPYGAEKFKKADATDGFDIRFAPNRDIIATLGALRKPGQRVVGFAAETSNLIESMRGKLKRKNADMIVGNLVGSSDAGFGAATNRVRILDSTGRDEELPLLSKPDVAWSILEWLRSL